MDWVGFEQLLFLIQNLLDDKIEHNELAAVAGSNHPTRSTSFILVICGIVLGLVSTIVITTPGNNE
jgi:hypothetical protein